MELNLLFLPLLGGYIFYRQFNVTAYAAVRASGEHLLFASAACGLAFLVFARVIAMTMPGVASAPEVWIGCIGRILLALSIFAIWASIPRLARTKRRVRTLKSRHSILEALGAVAIGLLIAHILSALLLDVGTWAPPLTVAASWACATIGLTHQLSMPLHRTALRSSLVAITIGVILIFILCHLHDIHELWAALSDFRVSPVDAGNESRSEASIGDTNMGTAFLACLIGATLWLPLNMIIPPQDALSWLHRSEQTNELDAFLYSAAAKQLLVLLSLADGKFYVGYIQQLSKNPTAQSSWVRILPVVSGYRTDVSKELNFTTFYQDVYEDLSKKSDFNEESLLSFTKILPIANITSANPFDPNIYMLFARETLDHQATDDEKSADNGEPAPRQIDARVDQATNTTR